MAYATVEQADTYIGSMYSSTSTEGKRWAALGSDDKSAYLNRASFLIDGLPLRGRKTTQTQEAEFPRYPDLSIPSTVTNACVEQALSLSDEQLTSQVDKYKQLKACGVKSYSIGKLSESFGDIASGQYDYGVVYGLTSTATMRYLRSWMTGGFHIV